jgi:hypothetical protein
LKEEKESRWKISEKRESYWLSSFNSIGSIPQKSSIEVLFVSYLAVKSR